jgi:hypothetical protein
MHSSVVFLTLLLTCACACDRTPEVKPDTPPPSAPKPQPEKTTAPVNSIVTPAPTTVSYKLPSLSRLVAIGDVHGDLRALRAALRLGGAIDSDDKWIGKDLTVVQTGDQVDRGDQDREVLDVLEKLEAEAKAAGGALVVLNGNHELMNASLDFRYVTHKSFQSFGDLSARASGPAERVPEDERGRAAAFAPGGVYALKLAQHLTVALVGDTLFSHAGVLPAHFDYGLDRINADAKAFLSGQKPLAKSLAAEDSPIWNRFYGGDVDDRVCEVVSRVLKDTGAKRLVVGHTVQKEGINGACQDRLFRIDVGLSAYYGNNPPQVLEITANGARPLKAGASAGTSKSKDGALHSSP